MTGNWIHRGRWMHFKIWLMWRLLPEGSEIGSCAGRYWRRFVFDRREYTIGVRRLDAPDDYSREEIYRMLMTVREQEERQGWHCPEPFGVSRLHGGLPQPPESLGATQ